IDAALALGRHAALGAELEALTTEHPLRERLRAARMLALYRCGREPEALALYDRPTVEGSCPSCAPPAMVCTLGAFAFMIFRLAARQPAARHQSQDGGASGCCFSAV